MKGLITCEESQEVTKAFRSLGHEFYSNDIQDCSGNHPEWHIKDDCFHVLSSSRFTIALDFLGAHVDCTFMTNAGVRWLASKTPRSGYEWSDKYQVYMNWERYAKMEQATRFFKAMYANIQRVGKGYIENPIMHKYAMELIGIKPTQIIQPYWFGTPQMKATCLWLVGLPELRPTNLLTPPKRDDDYEAWVAWQKCWTASPGPDRAKLRSKTDPNIATAMSHQWGIENQLQKVA